MKVPTIRIGKSSELPLIGLGTWELQGEQCETVVRMALDIGYRHFDTAHFYENHEAIQKGIRGFPREELFITSKFFVDQLSQESVEETCDIALRELGIDYLDLYLIHYPDRKAHMEKILEEMEALVEKKKVRAIGVSNFTIHHLQDLLNCNLHPSVNQIEIHPYLFQKELWHFCQKQNIQIVSFRSLGKGGLVKDPILEKIGKKYGKSPAQIALHWLVEKKIPVIPKASSKKHLKENFNIFDMTLEQEDLDLLDNMEIKHRFCAPSWSDYDY